VATVSSSNYSDLGEPLQAAMIFLAVSNTAKAVSTLSRSHEVILAYMVGTLLEQDTEPIILKLLAQCAERDKRWELARDIWRLHPDGERMHLPLLAIRIPDRAMSPCSADEQRAQLEVAIAAGDCPAAVLAAVCTGDFSQAAQRGVEGLYEIFGRSQGWSVEEGRGILDSLESVPLNTLQVRDIAGVLACASYTGLVEASQLGYVDLLYPLAQTLRNIITHQSLQFPVSTAEITFLEATSSAQQKPRQALQSLTTLAGSSDLPPHLRPACEQQKADLERRIQSSQADPSNSSFERGLLKLAGGHLPACYKRYAKTSVLTNQLIRGPAFELEDHKLYVSLSEALAWARVNAFSPLNTGCKITPV